MCVTNGSLINSRTIVAGKIYLDLSIFCILSVDVPTICVVPIYFIINYNTTRRVFKLN